MSISLNDMRKRDQRNVRKVLALLEEKGGFSIFEATDNVDIAETMDKIVDRKLVDLVEPSAYPWTKISLTDAGRKLLGRGVC